MSFLFESLAYIRMIRTISEWLERRGGGEINFCHGVEMSGGEIHRFLFRSIATLLESQIIAASFITSNTTTTSTTTSSKQQQQKTRSINSKRGSSNKPHNPASTLRLLKLLSLMTTMSSCSLFTTKNYVDRRHCYHSHFLQKNLMIILYLYIFYVPRFKICFARRAKYDFIECIFKADPESTTIWIKNSISTTFLLIKFKNVIRPGRIV